jgi:hypothetical protein
MGKHYVSGNYVQKHYVSVHNFQSDGGICSSDTYVFESGREEKPSVSYYLSCHRQFCQC